MRVRYHAATAVTAAAIVYATAQSITMAMSCLIMGIFVDLDHLVDYFIQLGPTFDIQRFFHSSYGRKYRYSYLIFHGWEWLAIWSLAAIISGWNHWITGAFIGYCLHLCLDQIGNRPHPLGYSMIWRVHNGFHFNDTFPVENWPSEQDKDPDKSE